MTTTDDPAADLVTVLRDWTAQRRAEAASLASESRLQLALSAADIVGTWDWNVAGDRIHADERLARLYGLGPEQADAGVSSATFLKAIHPDDQLRIRRRTVRALRTAGEFAEEFRLVQADGSVRWVFASGRCFGAADGRPLRFPGVAVDVTSRKQAEEQQRESDIRLRLAIEAGQIGTFDYDLDKDTLRWDARCRELFSLSPDVPVTYDDAFLAGLHPDDRGWVDRAVRQAIASPDAPPFDVEYRTVGLEDGVLRWVAARGRPLAVDGRVVRFIGTIRDITQRKVAVQRLRETEERYRLAARATNDAIWDWDLASDEVLWNEAVRRLFGYAADEVTPTWDWRRQRIHPDDARRVVGGMVDVIHGGAEHWSAEYRFRRADGGYAFVLDRGYVIRDGDGRAERMIGAMLDITERKAAEERQRLLADELQHRVKNTLALVQAIAIQTMRGASSLDEARQSFSARLVALARAHDVLTRTSWAGSPIAAIVEGALTPHLGSDSGRVRTGGPDVELSPRLSLALALALHELATNAVKYGSLSNETGGIDIVWERAEGPETPRLRLRWREHGGPLVSLPQHRGFGSRLIERSFAGEPGGAATLVFDPAGLVCTIEVGLDETA